MMFAWRSAPPRNWLDLLVQMMMYRMYIVQKLRNTAAK